MNLISRTVSGYNNLVKGLDWLSPLSLLSFRLWVAVDFWRAGLVKIDDMSGTVSLFENVYHVPILPPVTAAYLGTGVELVLPWFLAFGAGSRMTAAVLFVYNIIAVISYPDLWPGGLRHDFLNGGFIDHKAWALMLLATLLLGPGKLSVDHLLKGRLSRTDH